MDETATWTSQESELLETGCFADTIATANRHVRNMLCTQAEKSFLPCVCRLTAKCCHPLTIASEQFLVIVFLEAFLLTNRKRKRGCTRQRVGWLAFRAGMGFVRRTREIHSLEGISSPGEGNRHDLLLDERQVEPVRDGFEMPANHLQSENSRSG